MKNRYIVLGNYCEDIDDVQTELLSNRKVIFIYQDLNEDLIKGKYITINDFDDIIANDNGYCDYWTEKIFIKNVMIYENQTEIDLPKGDYNFYAIDEIE